MRQINDGEVCIIEEVTNLKGCSLGESPREQNWVVVKWKEAFMLDSYFFGQSRAQPYYQDENFNIWKFPAITEKRPKQKRPVILNYSIMTRAYGTCLNPDSFINHLNRHGFDVYLMDWGKDGLFTLSGWTLDNLADALDEKAITPLLKEHEVDDLNVFGICIGGLIVSHLINRRANDSSTASGSTKSRITVRRSSVPASGHGRALSATSIRSRSRFVTHYGTRASHFSLSTRFCCRVSAARCCAGVGANLGRKDGRPSPRWFASHWTTVGCRSQP